MSSTERAAMTPEQAAILHLLDRITTVEALLKVERSGRMVLERDLRGQIRALQAQMAALKKGRVA